MDYWREIHTRVDGPVRVTFARPGEPVEFWVSLADLVVEAEWQRHDLVDGPTHKVRLQHSPDGETWTDLATFPEI